MKITKEPKYISSDVTFKKSEVSYELLMVVQQGMSLFIKPFKVPIKNKHFFKNVFVILLSSSAVYVEISCALCGLLYSLCTLLNLYTLCE